MVASSANEAATPPPAQRGPALLEFALVLAILASVCWVAWRFHRDGMLPQPFIYDTYGTWSDWFDTAYWANNRGAFDAWQTVYPPLSFVFLKIFSIHGCYEVGPVHAGMCDWVGDVSIFGSYIINCILAFKCFHLANPKTAILRTMATMIGLPMLYTFERGNLILPCFAFYILGHGRLLKAAWMRWLAIAFTINFKPYLLLAVLPQAARRRWRWLEGCGVASVLLYLVTYAIEGSGDPFQMAENYKAWFHATGNLYWWSLYSSTTYTPLIDAMHGLALGDYVGTRILSIADFVLPLAIHLGQAGVLLAIGFTWLRSAPIPMHRLAALGMCFVMSTTNPGLYSLVFVTFLVFLEPWRGRAVIVAIICAYLISISADIILLPVVSREQDNWVTAHRAVTTFGVGVAHILRPGLLLLIEYALVAQTLVDIVRFDRSRVTAGFRPSSSDLGVASPQQQL